MSGNGATPPKKKWTSHERIVVFLMVVGIIVAMYVPTRGSDDQPADDGHPSASPSASQSPSQPAPSIDSASPAETLSLPACFADGKVTSCQGAHTEERAALDSCTNEGLIYYMGGNPELDILREGLSANPTDEECAITGIESRTAQSLKDILPQPAGDAYRQCWDKETNLPIACDLPHFAEAIYSGGPEAVDCEAHFGNYVGRPYHQFRMQLNVELRPGPTTSCWAKVRAHTHLTASIRDLGNQQLPLKNAS